MKFIWDENKNQANIIKHGINFKDVKKIYDNPMIVSCDSRFDYGEERLIGYGLLDFW